MEKGDIVEFNLTMDIKRLVALDKIKENENRIALQRGPIIYCVEHADNGGKAMNIIIPDNAALTSEYNKDLLEGVVTISGEVPVVKTSADGLSVSTSVHKITAIPYYTWSNRGAGQMQVWIPRKAVDVKVGSK